MNEKVQSLITSVSLDSASFAGTGELFSPTSINFFFGSNGTGKSTIATAIRDNVGVRLATGRTIEDIDVLVYNREFIEENMQSYRGLPGVYTLNKENVEIQQLIDSKESERSAFESSIINAKTMREKTVEERNGLTASFQESAWAKKKPLSDRFPDVFKGKGKKQSLADAVLAASPEQADLAEIGSLYSSVFSADARTYGKFNDAPSANVLDSLEGASLLSTPIVNSADTDLARFFKKVGSTDWARTGHDSYAESAAGSCPYCARPLPAGFEEEFIASFDQTYQANLKALDGYLQEYRAAANRVIPPLNNTPDPLLPQIEIQAYKDKMQLLSSTIRSNIEVVRTKLADPGSILSLEPTEPLFSEVAEMIRGFNSAINMNNMAVGAKASKQAECVEAVMSHLAYELASEISNYRLNLQAKTEQIAELDKTISDANESIRALDTELKDLRRQTVETDTAKDNINQMLRDSGMEGLRLVSRPDAPNVYEIRRADDSVAENLSEGERNFIAFLYFCQLVQGTDAPDGSTHDKVVVIDDPVSSMDNQALFIVSALTRQMIEICRNAADGSSPTETSNYIKQIFILTHNAYFHREVSYDYVERYRYASYYLVRKMDAKSSVRLCEEVNPQTPTEMLNVNPVKNSYAALWEEYKQLSTPIPLMNVIRRILEYYFLQLCGYEGATLRQVVLVEARQRGRYESDEQFHLASAMLSYIKSNTMGMNDGFDYVESGMTAEDCKVIFKMIFECMQQSQHYEMMMQER